MNSVFWPHANTEQCERITSDAAKKRSRLKLLERPVERSARRYERVSDVTHPDLSCWIVVPALISDPRLARGSDRRNPVQSETRPRLAGSGQMGALGDFWTGLRFNFAATRRISP